MLNPTNFNARWETPLQQDPNVAGDALVSQDGKGRIECRSLDDGRVRWSYELADASTVVAESGKVLLHRDATHDPSKLPMVVLLDLESARCCCAGLPRTGSIGPGPGLTARISSLRAACSRPTGWSTNPSA